MTAFEWGPTGGTAVTVYLPGLMARPATPDAYLALPEIESAVCPDCGRPGSAVDSVFTCGEHQPHVQWRWPGVLGMD
mgnify:CR=1 FL=1